ncbi:MAG: hypothetical protein ACR2PK_19715 [Acidimicrobiales bacterium]
MAESWHHETSSVDREHVVGDCPECGAAELAQYPVLSEGGWYLVVKCQDCLHSVDREPWHRLGYVVRLEDQLL